MAAVATPDTGVVPAAAAEEASPMDRVCERVNQFLYQRAAMGNWFALHQQGIHLQPPQLDDCNLFYVHTSEDALALSVDAIAYLKAVGFEAAVYSDEMQYGRVYTSSLLVEVEGGDDHVFTVIMAGLGLEPHGPGVMMPAAIIVDSLLTISAGAPVPGKPGCTSVSDLVKQACGRGARAIQEAMQAAPVAHLPLPTPPQTKSQHLAQQLVAQLQQESAGEVAHLRQCLQVAQHQTVQLQARLDAGVRKEPTQAPVDKLRRAHTKAFKQQSKLDSTVKGQEQRVERLEAMLHLVTKHLHRVQEEPPASPRPTTAEVACQCDDLVTAGEAKARQQVATLRATYKQQRKATKEQHLREQRVQRSKATQSARDHKAAVAKEQARTKSAQGRVAGLEKQVKKLQTQLAAVEDQRKQYQDTADAMDMLRRMNEDLMADAKSIGQQLKTIVAENKALHRKNADLNRELQRQAEENRRVVAQTAAMEQADQEFRVAAIRDSIRKAAQVALANPWTEVVKRAWRDTIKQRILPAFKTLADVGCPISTMVRKILRNTLDVNAMHPQAIVSMHARATAQMGALLGMHNGANVLVGEKLPFLCSSDTKAMMKTSLLFTISRVVVEKARMADQFNLDPETGLSRAPRSPAGNALRSTVTKLGASSPNKRSRKKKKGKRRKAKAAAAATARKLVGAAAASSTAPLAASAAPVAVSSDADEGHQLRAAREVVINDRKRAGILMQALLLRRGMADESVFGVEAADRRDGAALVADAGEEESKNNRWRGLSVTTLDGKHKMEVTLVQINAANPQLFKVPVLENMLQALGDAHSWVSLFLHAWFKATLWKALYDVEF